MANENEEQELYLIILKQPLNQFLEDLKSHQNEMKDKQKQTLRTMLRDFYAKALSILNTKK